MKHLALLLCLAFAPACHSKQPLTAPPPPLRPDPEPKETKPVAVEQKDCDPVDPQHQPASKTFGERSITESSDLTVEAKGMLASAASPEVDRTTREQTVTDAVDKLITALRADPYNVPGTYALAGAYAHMNRRQCALNLLERLMQMRNHASKRPDVEASLDRLLGRKQPLDPDFSDMRKDERFRALIQKMCEGTNDANCVYGTHKP